MTGHRAALPLTPGVGGISQLDYRPTPVPPGRREPGPWVAAQPLAGGLVAQDARAATCLLRPSPESVKTGREFTRTTLADWSMSGLGDLAELVVSELVTNALRHGVPSARKATSDHCIRLRLLTQAPFVMCMVTDPGCDIPVLRDPGPSAESGRGLNVVESCCVRWGWHLLDEGGKIVWALLRPPL
ncbi:MAG TPA: ATP-binding protein [Streptosporangiaceae bacterium]